MLRFAISVLLVIVIIGACNPQHEESAFDREAMALEIGNLGNDIVQALNEQDSEILIRDFRKSDSISFLIDGMVFEGYEAISSLMERLPSGRKAHELNVVNERVQIIDENAGIHIVEFSERVTLQNDSVVVGNGVWSAVYHRKPAGWEIVMVHESHQRE
ncbi:MAG: hypothetical protein P8X57_14270 [Cyclobacteriaceae bacterium]